MPTIALRLDRQAHAAHLRTFLGQLSSSAELIDATAIAAIAQQISDNWAEVSINLDDSEALRLKTGSEQSAHALLAELLAPSFNDAANVLLRQQSASAHPPRWKGDVLAGAALAVVLDGVVLSVRGL